MPVMRRSNQHEVRACPADFSASHHQLKMRRLGMFAANIETMPHRHGETRFVTG
jgi:hypothetical protein